jgi:preprotein translocase subunit SecA
MLSNVMKKIFGTKQDRDLKSLIPLVKDINSLELKWKS